LPTNDVFKLPVTAINVVTDNPQELGNCIVDCLQNKLASDIKGETSILGYAIKADVFVSYVMCTMKVCIYSGDVDTKFIVEFQRLHGCNVTFVEALRQVAEHLQVSKFQCELDFKPRPNLPEEGLSMEDVTGEDLMPLINMAGLAEMPLQQAEAAQGLVSLAETENKDIMDLLCESKVLEAIGKLLKSSSLEVLYPTAHLYKHLANETKASGLFENLPELANTIKEKKLAPIVNNIFEEVLKIREIRDPKIMT